MRLSEIPDNVKRLLLATYNEDYDIEEVDALTTEELWFVRYHAMGVPAV